MTQNTAIRSADPFLLKMKGIYKCFGNTQALKNVSLTLQRGTVHALMGENGAGKSTLMKILAGIHQMDKGTIVYRGKQVQFSSPKEAIENGISMIHQELSSLPDMTIAENIFLGRELHINKPFPMLDAKQMNQESKKLLSEIGLDINPNTLMKELSVSQMQMVEIAKAVSVNAEIIIMDEPTSAITTREVEKLFEIIHALRNEGRCIIYITHKMEEVFEIADCVTVFRDGSYIGTFPAETIDSRQLIRYMVDRDLEDIFPKREKNFGHVLLEVKNLSSPGAFSNVSFCVRSGEIVGLAGLMGSGRTEIVETIFGIRPVQSGEIIVNGKLTKSNSPRKAIKKNIALVTEDRKRSGLVLNMSIVDNITLPATKLLSSAGIIMKKKRMQHQCTRYIEKLKIKTKDPTLSVDTLSGGNQQKVVLGKWLMMHPQIIIFDEPTRGIDIGAKSDFYQIIADLASQGAAIIFISSEMPEVLGMCDRMIIMHEGRQSGEIDREVATQELLLQYATASIAKE